MPALKWRDDGAWDYCEPNADGDLRPAGYCAGSPSSDWQDAPFERVPDGQWSKGGASWRSKFHTDGHATQAEAEACWREYCADREAAER